MTITRWISGLALGLALPAAAAAQTSPLARGVPLGPATSTTLTLSLADAITRGLDRNLAVILEEQQVHDAGSARLQALSALVPHLSGRLSATRQVSNLAAFGFTGFDGLALPNLIGPFDVYDARLALSTPVVDVSAWQHLRAESALQTAEQADYRRVRETVVLAVGNLYLMTLADQARVETAGTQVSTAEALARLATDQHDAGLVPQIDVIRQQVQVQSARSQQIAATTALGSHKLQLARAIGLPAGQPFELSTTSAFIAAPIPDLDAAVAEAAAHRQDVVSARARLTAAQAARRSAVTSALPSLHVDADIGALGNTPSSALRTFSVAAAVHVPIFSGGQRRADVQHADALLHQREAELADLENGVHYEVAEALLQVQAAAAGVDVAEGARSLARQELAQAQDRFRAGVASSIELVQAQDAVARSSEQYIASVYTHTLAKAGLAKAMGEVEARFLALVGGQQ
jgi:outer membrane protein TolC